MAGQPVILYQLCQLVSFWVVCATEDAENRCIFFMNLKINRLAQCC